MSAVLRLWNNLGLVYLPRSVCKIFHSYDFLGREGVGGEEGTSITCKAY